MCVIIAKPTGVTVDRKTLLSAWDMNDDGAGITWAENGKLFIEKGFMDCSTFLEFWNARSWVDVPAIIHFRIATHGDVNEDNTHPFWVFNNQLAFAHNGIFGEFPDFDGSDTVAFNRRILKQLPQNFLNNSGIRIMIEDFLGHSSKLAFLDNDGRIDIFGEQYGEWVDGSWYSNLNHQYFYRTNAFYKDDEWGGDSLGSDSRSQTNFGDEVMFHNIHGEVLCDDDLTDLDECIMEAGTPEQNTDVMAALLGYPKFYCYPCGVDYVMSEVMEIDTDDGLVLPECPNCCNIKGVFGVGKGGLNVNGVITPGYDEEE